MAGPLATYFGKMLRSAAIAASDDRAGVRIGLRRMVPLKAEEAEQPLHRV